MQFSLGIDVFLKGLGTTHIPAVARDGRNLQAAGGARTVRSVKMTDGVKSQHLGSKDLPLQLSWLWISQNGWEQSG